jgi:membrane protein implicated in regulation of membrane protease activity
MGPNASAATGDLARNNSADTSGGRDCGGLVSFLAAGAVLSASLIIGSSASMVFAGANDLIGAILEGFLELGLWAFGALFAAATLVAAMAKRRQSKILE